MVGFAVPVRRRVSALAGRRRRGAGGLRDPAGQRVGAFEELHGGDARPPAGRLAAFLLEQRHEVVVAGARPLAAQGHGPEAAVLHRGHEALPAAEGVRRLLAAEDLPLGPVKKRRGRRR